MDETLSQLLDGRQATDRLVAAGLDLRAASPDYVRHKPGQCTVVGYHLTTADGAATRGYAIWCPDPTRATAIHAKALSLRPRPSAVGPGVLRLSDNTVVYGFPNDARLRRLRWYTQPRKIKRSLACLPDVAEGISAHRTEVEILRYKPERRVVARIDLVSRSRTAVPVVLRYTTRRDALARATIARALRRGGVATPAPIAQLEEGRVGIDEYAAGEQLRSLIDLGLVCPTATADAIQRFHGTVPPPACIHRSPSDELSQARRALAGLAEFHPTLSAQLAALAERLISAEPRQQRHPRLVHGDLHPKNLLGDPTGGDGNITFVDLERVALGQPATDLGRLLGHAKALEVRDPDSHWSATEFARAVVDRYRAGVPIPEPELRWYTAVALIDQAALVARHLEGDWRRSSGYLAALAFRELDQQPAGTVSA